MRWHWPDLTKQIKRWHDVERFMGHSVDSVDIRNEFHDRLEMQVKVLTAKQTLCHELPAQLEVYGIESRKKLDMLKKGTKKAQDSFTDRLMAKIGARSGAPQRFVKWALRKKRSEVT